MRPQTQYKLEYKLLYSCVVAGKSAKFTREVMERILAHPCDDDGPDFTPLSWIRWLINNGLLLKTLKTARSGNYTKLERAFRAIVEANFDLRACSPQDLEKIPGIGPKTSRFFILWTRPGAQYAALDTHILKWLRYRSHKAPLATPTGAKYTALENHFLAEAKKRGMTAGELDERIWRWCEQNNNKGLDYSKADSWPKELR